MLADLPSNQMQKSCNILLEGMVESTTNPTTTLWNTILPMIIQDVEDEELHVGKFSLKTSIVTVSADQPAKRSLFGFKAHQASQSCFFCLSTGTFHKLGGSSKKVNTTEANYFVELSERSEVRSRDGTILDSEQGVNGFGDTPARIVQLIMPYDTPIDMLHNFGEGLCEVIIRESLLIENLLVQELLFHLPDANRLFKNVAPLSTFSFESSYQYALMGFSTRMTRNFSETVCSRALIHNSIRQEVFRRAHSNPSPSFLQFLTLTKGVVSRQSPYKNLITSKLDGEDRIVIGGSDIYGTLFLGCGTLVSEYQDSYTSNDVFFAKKRNGEQECCRFVGVVEMDGECFALSEPFRELPASKQFSSLMRAQSQASNSTENQLLLTIQLIENPERLNELDFSIQYANKPNNFMIGDTLPAWTREYRILRRLARKRWLEEEMITVGISIEEIKELDDLEEELTVEEVRMIDGIMTVQEIL
uniref:VID27 domain-containing protein n=1 Tax=Caenorhabditis tropicalis TaxID=1561998 RepID=A0A1I7UR03_9PELO